MSVADGWKLEQSDFNYHNNKTILQYVKDVIAAKLSQLAGTPTAIWVDKYSKNGKSAIRISVDVAKIKAWPDGANAYKAADQAADILNRNLPKNGPLWKPHYCKRRTRSYDHTKVEILILL